jgi:hypothetical protein
MFKRILIEGWAHFVPIISFCIFFAVFLAVTIRALRLRKSESDRLASLPLDNAAQSHHPDNQPDH